MTVVAITMEMGALSKEVARGVAAELGLRILYEDVVDAVTRRLGTSRTSVCRFIEGRAGWTDHARAAAARLDALARAEIMSRALQGAALLRGWGGEHLFAKVASVPRVRLCAPLERRIANLRGILGVDDEAFLRREIERSDASYASRLRVADAAKDRPASDYDLVINTGRTGVDSSVDQIVRLAREPRFGLADHDPALRAVALRSIAEAALAEDPRTAGVGIDVEVRPRCILLRGIVRDAAERRAAEEVVWRATRIADVRNRLIAMTTA